MLLAQMVFFSLLEPEPSECTEPSSLGRFSAVMFESEPSGNSESSSTVCFLTVYSGSPLS
jgi:hypothetical protein